MNLVYKAVTNLYYGVLYGLSPFNRKASLWVEGRQDLDSQLQEFPLKGNIIWFHCASLGEFEQGKPVMDHFIKEHPEWKLVVTFFSPSGYQNRKDYNLADKVMYLPVESKKNVQSFLNAVRPKMAVFVKYEFWYGYMSELFRQEIPLIFISSTFRGSDLFFQWYGSWFLTQISKVSYFFVQDKISETLLIENGIQQVEISGDTRFDRVKDTVQVNESISDISQFKTNSRVIIFGSAWEKEEEFAVQLIDSLPTGWKVIYAPHEINNRKIEKFRQEIRLNSILYTELKNEGGNDSRVLILNTIGHLARTYKYADVAVVGGGFIDGIHNILEPLSFGAPVVFGPNHKKFWEGNAAIENNVGFEVKSKDEFMDMIIPLLSTIENDDSIKEKSQQFILERTGATDKICSYLDEVTKNI